MSILISKYLLYTTQSNDKVSYHKFILYEDDVYCGLIDFSFWAKGWINPENISIWAIIDVESWNSNNLKNTDYTVEDIPNELISDCTNYNLFVKKLLSKLVG